MAQRTFADVVAYCADSREFVENFDRLTGHHLSQFGRRSPFDAAIDAATGRDEEAALDFMWAVYELVWLRLPQGDSGG